MPNSQYVPKEGETCVYKGKHKVIREHNVFPLDGTELRCTSVKMVNDVFVRAYFLCLTGPLKGKIIYLSSQVVFDGIHRLKPQ